MSSDEKWDPDPVVMEGLVRIVESYPNSDEKLWSAAGELYSWSDFLREINNRTPLGRDLYDAYAEAQREIKGSEIS